MTKTILVVFGDTQVGSSTAIAPPKFEIHNNDSRETQVVSYNPLQQWLYESWVDAWDYVKMLTGIKGKRRQNRLVVVHLGDVIDGNHHGTHQIVQDVGDQKLIALDLLHPVADMADNFFGIIGTEAHAGKAGADEIDIYKNLDADEYGQTLALEIDGKIHDFSHHSRIGTRPWTSQAAAVATETILDYVEQGMTPPNYIWRAHNHVIDDSGNKLKGCRCITIPSWQLKTAFAHRVAGNRQRSDIGMFIIDGGNLDATKSRYEGQPDKRRVIRL